MDLETRLDAMAAKARRAALSLPLSLKSEPMPLGSKGEDLVFNPEGPLALCWTELAAAPQWRLDKMQPVLHVVKGLHHRCIAIAVDKRWLCSSGGALALFTTTSAAGRFLRMLRLPAPRRGAKKRIHPQRGVAHQCFTIEHDGLTLCTRCQGLPEPGGRSAIADDEWPMTEGEF